MSYVWRTNNPSFSVGDKMVRNSDHKEFDISEVSSGPETTLYRLTSKLPADIWVNVDNMVKNFSRWQDPYTQQKAWAKSSGYNWREEP